MEKRVSLVFRHVTRNWVFQEDGIWKSYKVRADGGIYDLSVLDVKPNDTVHQRVAKRQLDVDIRAAKKARKEQNVQAAEGAGDALGNIVEAEGVVDNLETP